ncbi:sigma-54 interaction domain-containing protein [Desulfoluna spongiiphila]|uniref:sigma-54 interaction domain-containing protein n=1 Tax=Desulfoluna spongiiphila TaxID=419481 RepID=UPI001252AAA7|nr:sigma-54 dependent transcriptional regulator [Desulfoluna spongiiphila]VVS94059.1 rna polymerase sigma factor 54 interaction domain [Desulfoluna spongiiphila]
MDTPLVGSSPSIQKIREIIRLVSQDTSLNVVITGETGVGKEVVARVLYELSPRRKKEFVKVNCAAIPDTLLESELFGVEQGAYTGANRKRKGKFEIADGGVLFLDEIGDMSFHLQAKLLHVLQSGEYSRLGSETNITSNTWVISATNHDLKQRIEEKKFREDLYYRLNMIQINIPPLRERPEDIPELISHYTRLYQDKYPDRVIAPLNTHTYGRLCSFSWPGNVRQLVSVLQRILLIGCDEETLSEILHEHPAPPDNAPGTTPTTYGSLVEKIRAMAAGTPEAMEAFSLKAIKKTATDIVEKEVISQVLDRTNWNRTHASKILKISYKTLLTKIDRLNISEPN